MLQTEAFDPDTAAMLQRLYDVACAQFVSIAPNEPRMRDVIATAIICIATNGQRNPERILRYARFKVAELMSTPLL